MSKSFPNCELGWIIARREIAIFRLRHVVLLPILFLSLSLFGQEVQTNYGFSCIELGGQKTPKSGVLKKLGRGLQVGTAVGGQPQQPSARVYVSRIAPGSPAAVSELRVGDHLLSINGVMIYSLQDVGGRAYVGYPAVLTVDRAGRTLSVDLDSIRSLQYGFGCTDSDQNLVGVAGLPIQTISEDSPARGLLADAGLAGSNLYIIKVEGQPVPGPYLGSGGQLVDDSEDVRKSLDVGVSGSFAFTILSRPSSKAQGCDAWTQITFTLQSWQGGIKTGPPMFVPYIGGRVVTLQGSPQELAVPVANAAKASDSLDEEILHTVETLDSEYSYQINQHFGSPPKQPQITQESFPRYNDLARGLKLALQKHRLFPLYQALSVIQRVSSTYVLAGPFYATAAGLGFCDDDVCRYSGSIFVRLRSPSVGDYLTPGIALQYAGLRNYITVSGAPETIPEFSQVDFDQFADVRQLQLSLATFHPTPEETAKYVLPAERGYQQQLKAWALDGIRMEQSYLQNRLKLIRALTTPLIGAHAIKYLSPYGMLPQNISGEMQRSLPMLLRVYEGNVTLLLDEISSIEANGDAYPSASATLMSEYIQGWIVLSWSNPSDFPTPASMPWGELQSWTHFPTPSLAADGTPVQPPWWAEFKSLHQGYK